MKALALVSQSNNSQPAQWQFDKIMAAIAYDFDINIVFLNSGIEQLLENKAWKCLEMYAIKNVFYLSNSFADKVSTTMAQPISHQQFQLLLQQSEIVI
jgi:sulfur relay (sulfurtransferase) DsrF/TusC family protein